MSEYHWAWERYERTYWVNEKTGAKLYIGHFVQMRGLYTWDEAEVQFWAHHPVKAMRLMAASGDPTIFADQIVN